MPQVTGRQGSENLGKEIGSWMAERGWEEEWIREQPGCKCLSIWVVLSSFSAHGVTSHGLTSWILRVTASASSLHLAFSWLSRCHKAFSSYLALHNLEVAKYHLHVYIQNPLNVLNDGHYVSNSRVARINSIVTFKGLAAECDIEIWILLQYVIKSKSMCIFMICKTS